MALSPEAISDRLGATPASPGVYIMRDARGSVLYVGKAASLRSRLRSYFGSSLNLEPKIRRMVSHVADFEYMVTDTEAEALILENTLIKKYKPRYNARLKDDKTYPFIKIDLGEDYPRVSLTRRVRDDGARYFGPYASVGSVRTTLALLKKLFPYRSCTKTITGRDERPCLEYYINRCVAPCTGYANQEDYRQVIDQVILFMEGKTERVLRDLRRKMNGASETLQFERAAALRDQIRAIEHAMQQQKMDTGGKDDQDVIGMASSTAGETWVEVFYVRRGKLTGRDHFIMEGTGENAPADVLTHFVTQFYDSAVHIPREVLVQHPIGEDRELVERWLSEKRSTRVRIRVPERGAKRRMVNMAAENASQGLKQRAIKWQSDAQNLGQAMDEVSEVLNLPRPPHRIECYDISNIQGTTPVGSMVVFEGGRPKNNRYRRFQIKRVEGVDDYSMMQEMLRRRFRRLAEHLSSGGGGWPAPGPMADARSNGDAGETIAEVDQVVRARAKEDTWAVVPDLVIIDGGKGHLSAALQVFLELGLVEHIPLASLAKEREELFVPDDSDPILLPRGSQGLFLVQRIRDEAHRFAITYHRQRRSKGSVKSGLDDVPGIGPKRRRMLLRRFGSIAAVKQASVEELVVVPGMTRTLATKLKDALS